MWRGKEVPFDPDWIREAQSDLESLDPMEFWIAIEEIEIKLKLKKVKTHVKHKSNPERKQCNER